MVHGYLIVITNSSSFQSISQDLIQSVFRAFEKSINSSLKNKDYLSLYTHQLSAIFTSEKAHY